MKKFILLLRKRDLKYSKKFKTIFLALETSPVIEIFQSTILPNSQLNLVTSLLEKLGFLLLTNKLELSTKKLKFYKIQPLLSYINNSRDKHR